MADYSKVCSEDLNKTPSDKITEELDRYEHDLQFKTEEELFDECVALKNQVMSQQKIIEHFEAEKKNFKAEKKNWVRDNQIIADEKVAEVSKNQAILEEIERLKKLMNNQMEDLRKELSQQKKKMEELEEKLQRAEEGLFGPTIGLLKRTLTRQQPTYERVFVVESSACQTDMPPENTYETLDNIRGEGGASAKEEQPKMLKSFVIQPDGKGSEVISGEGATLNVGTFVQCTTFHIDASNNYATDVPSCVTARSSDEIKVGLSGSKHDELESVPTPV